MRQLISVVACLLVICPTLARSGDALPHAHPHAHGQAHPPAAVSSAEAPTQSKPATLQPWEPINETFRDCQGACGKSGRNPDAVVQPEAKPGQLTYCPVSGAVFEVKSNSHKATVDGKSLYFCCEGCAKHFVVARDEVLSKRGLARTK